MAFARAQAFETDMILEMCGTEQKRSECTSFMLWFWLNVVIDMWFITDIVVNCRTGYISEGHFVSGDWLALKHYLKGSFMMDCLGSFPLNLLLMTLSPRNPYGDVRTGSPNPHRHRQPAPYAPLHPDTTHHPRATAHTPGPPLA